jgi:phosphatidylserine decarboxylase
VPTSFDRSDRRPGEGGAPTRWDRLRGLLFAVLPQHAISRLVYALARLRTPLAARFIPWYVRHYGVALEEAESTDPRDYPSFNAFFTRGLRPGVRALPEAPDAVACPVDGTLSQIGAVQDGRILQAKGERFSVVELLAGDRARAARYEDGGFATLYLSPRDYHRVHMPVEGELERSIHVPGRLFPVAPFSVRGVPKLFLRNERVINHFHTPAGPLALVLVGALNVGAIETVWSGPPAPAARRRLTSRDFEPGEVRLDRGDEMGRFNLGSTVILIFGPRPRWQPALGPGDHLRVGQVLGYCRDEDQARSGGNART